MPHEHPSKLTGLAGALACLILASQAVSVEPVSAQPGSPEPAQQSRIWSEPTPISDPNDSVDSTRPDIAVCASGVVYVVWEQAGEIWHRVNDPVTGWGTAGRIQFRETGETARGSEPAIAADINCNLHLVWKKFWWNNYEVFYTFDDGSGFVTPARVSRTDAQSGQPDIAIDPAGEPRVVWVEATLGYKLYEGRPIASSPGYWTIGPIPGSEGLVPSLAIDGDGRSHLTWMEVEGDGSSDVAYKWQEQAGEWPQWWFNVSESPSPSRQPDLAISADKALVVWQETIDGDDEIYATWRSLSRFASFVSARNLSNSDASSRAPAASVDGQGKFIVAWDEGSPTDAILGRPWPGSGNWWSIQALSQNGTNVKDAAIAASAWNSHAYAVWTQQDTPDDTWDVYFSDTELTVYRFYLALVSSRHEGR